MIRQFPGGRGLYSGVSALAGGRGQAELMTEMERMYVAGIYARGQAAGYGRHVRFEHGGVREMPAAPPQRRPAVPAPEADPWEAVAAVLREGLAPESREIEGTFLAELFLAELAAAKRGGQR